MCGFAGTVSEAIDLIGQYQDAGIDLLTHADRPNDLERYGLQGVGRRTTIAERWDME